MHERALARRPETTQEPTSGDRMKTLAKTLASDPEPSESENEKAPFPGLLLVAGAGFEPATSG